MNLRKSSLLVAVLLIAPSARAEEIPPAEPPIVPVPTVEFRLPFEIEQGALIGRPNGSGYTGALKLLPGLSFWNRLEVNALIDGTYRNPKVDLGGGGRLQFTVFSVLQNILAFRVGAQFEHLFWGNAQRGGAGLIVNAANLVHFAAWANDDFDRKQLYVTGIIGFNLYALFRDPVGAILRASSMEDVGNTNAK